jgi:glycosyltransferase involved in cell wall biosynthesis
MEIVSRFSNMVISVVIPNFNTGRYLESCITSILHQSNVVTELIIVDGHSKDNSIQIIDKYRQHFAKVIIEKDSNQAEAINKGFAASTGDIMCWLNADDIFCPTALRNVALLFSSFEEVSWITGRKTIIDDIGRIIQNGEPSTLTRGQCLAGAYRWIQQESTFWRRTLWNAVGAHVDESYALAVDLELWMRMFEYARLYPVDKNLGAFRIRPGQRSKTQADKYHTEAVQAIRNARQRVDEVYKTFVGEPMHSHNFITTQKEVLEQWPHLSSEMLKPIFLDKQSGKFTNPNPRPVPFDAAEVTTRTLSHSASHSNPTPSPLSEDSDAEIADYLLIPRNSTTGDDLSRFKDSKLGKRCWLMGNGPSLNEMDLSLFGGETVFCSNSAYLLFNRISWCPEFHVCVDTRVLPDTRHEIAEMLIANPAMTGFYPSELAIYDGTGRTLNTRLLLPRLSNKYHFRLKNMQMDNLPRSAFSLDVNDHLCTPNTVTIAMLQLACYMGFADIMLMGCDTSYKLMDTVSQQGPVLADKEGEKLFLTSTEDDDCNHFDPTYFGRGRQWHNPKVDDMIRHYTYAKQILDEAGIRVRNATVGGNLEVFERVDYRQVLAEK